MHNSRRGLHSFFVMSPEHWQIFIYFLFWPSLGWHLFDHLLWSIFQSSLHILQMTIFHMLDLCGQLSCTASTHVFLTLHSYSNSNKSITDFHWKIISLAGIWTSDLPSTKPMRYQLSSPGLDTLTTFKLNVKMIYQGVVQLVGLVPGFPRWIQLCLRLEIIFFHWKVPMY